jgi:hypothetical protein
MSGYQWLCCVPLVVALLWWIYLAIFRRDEFMRRAKTDPAEMRRNAEKAISAARAGVKAAQGWLKK